MIPRGLTVLKKYPFHPLLFALFPVLALLANNAFEIRLADASRVLVISAFSGTILLGISYLLGDQVHRAALLSTAVIIVFFTYGHFYEWGRQVSASTFQIVRHRYVLPATLVLLAVVQITMTRPEWAETLTPGLNALSLILVVMPLATVVRSEIQFLKASTSPRDPGSGACEVEGLESGVEAGKTAAEDNPDIYYIVLDGYARQDVLEQSFNFDNRPFLQALEGRGFYIAHGSQSNYASTGLSLASSLNMEYHNFPEDIVESEDPTRHWPSLSRSRVRKFLKCEG